ncbi:MAG: O-antigen ligase family protein [Candidatus Binatia bacterium]
MVHWSFLLFIFTIPFESADLNFTSESLALSKIAGLIFIASYFFHHNALFLHKNRGRSPARPPQAMWWFLGYLVIYVFNGFFISADVMSSFVGRCLTLVQLFVFFWVASRLLEEERLTRTVLLVFSLATALLAIGMLLSLPGFSQTVVNRVGERSTALGQNANVLATLMAPAAVILIGLALSATFKQLATKIMLAALAMPVLAASVSTGSRAGIAAFMIGCVTYLLPLARSKHRMTTVALVVCAITALLWFVVHSPTAFTRWKMTFEEGHVSGRETIFSSASDMFMEKPLLGWRPYEFQVELGRRVGILFGQRDAHNLYLHLLLEVGTVGAIPFFIGLWSCGRTAWRARNSHFGLLPLALLLTILAASMSGTGLARKPLWLVLAFAAAARATVPVRRRPKPAMFMMPRSPRGRA